VAGAGSIFAENKARHPLHLEERDLAPGWHRSRRRKISAPRFVRRRLFPEYADLRTPKNVHITFRHLLTMSHGQRWDESRGWKSRANNERQLLEARDPYRYVLEQKVASPPGVFFNYSGGATTLLSAALAKAVGQRIDAYAKEKLFEPLGITDVEWLSFTGSAEIAAFAGLRLRPRDLAKLGQLVADAGRWNGRQIIPAQWITESTAPRLNVEWARSAILWLSLVAGPFLAEWARPRLDCRDRQRRPAPFHRAQARSRHRRERVRDEAFHPGCHPQPVRTARCNGLSAPFRVKAGLDSGWLGIIRRHRQLRTDV
jgi:hypothetical protein